MPGRIRSREERAQHRVAIAQMVRFGRIHQEEIAKKLGIDQTTVSRELKSLREEWRQAAQADIGEVVAHELAKLDELEAETYKEWQRSKQAAEKRVVEDKPGRQGGARSAKLETTEQCGDPRYVSALLAIQERRAKLLGMDKPAKLETSGPNGGPIVHKTDGIPLHKLTMAELESLAKLAADAASR